MLRGTEAQIGRSAVLSEQISLNSSLKSIGGIKASNGELFNGNRRNPMVKTKIICYIADWSVNRAVEGNIINNLNNATDICTHIIYAFVHFNDTTGEFQSNSKSKCF